jgi:predicted MPP superfamily phosphohydrolase
MYFVNLLVVFGLIDIVRLINLGAKFSSDDLHTFREWWMLGGHVAIFLMFLIGYLNFHCPRVRTFDIAALGVPLQGRTVRILLVSDVHLGYFVDKQRWRKWVKLMNSQGADLIILAGDVADNYFEPIAQQNMHEEFNLLTARYGVWAVTGNHEYGHGNYMLLENYLRERTSVHYLRDTSELIDDAFYLVGRDDRTNGARLPIQSLINEFDRSKPTILIDHQPVNLAEAEENGITLELAGHTHAGQFFPVTVVVPWIFENPHGLSRRGDTQYIVSSGLGLWGPQCRFTSNSEIVNINFTF